MEDIQEPRMVVRTSDSIQKYKIVKNLRYIKTKEILQGKATVALTTPQHLLLIQGADEKLLRDFLKSLHSIALKNETGNFPVMVEPKIPKPKPKSMNSSLSILRSQCTSAAKIGPNSIASKLCSPILLGALSENLRSLELVNTKHTKFPAALGQISLESVILTDCGLTNEDFTWLDKLPIRKSLKLLNVSKNMITMFPSALVDCLLLNSVNLRENEIAYIPAEICRLQNLRSLNLAHNCLRYLPGNIIYLKLTDLDLTHNYLINDYRQDHNPGTSSFKAELKLIDLAALKIDSAVRYQLTHEDCPPRLIQKLRCLSTCVCEKTTIPNRMAQYFVATNGIKFATSYWLHPQKNDAYRTSNYIYLQYHFCEFFNRCESKKFRMLYSPKNCFRLMD